MSFRSFDVDLLIFDLDGTLADTRRDLADAVNHVRAALGREALDVPTVTRYVGDGVDKLLERALPDASAAERRQARRLFDDFYGRHYCDHTLPYPGIEEVLAYFAGKKKAVLTNKAEPFARPMIERMGLAGRFDYVMGARPDVRKKPAPDPILLLLDVLAVRPDRALLVGDSPQDIQAGKAAGVYTCAVTYGFRPADELRALAPDLVIDDPRTLMECVF